MRTLVPTEAQEQTSLFHWAKLQTRKYPELALMYHIPNGGSRNTVEAHNLKMQGVKPGVPDIFLPVARGGFHGLFIEMKRRKGGEVSQEQKGWLEALQGQGYRAEVCKGWEEAKNLIEKYLKGEK